MNLKTALLFCLLGSVGFALGIARAAFVPPPEPKITPDNIASDARQVVVQPGKIITLYCHPLVKTMVELPTGEDLIAVTPGDPRIEIVHFAGNQHFFSVQPQDVNITTDIQVITAHNVLLTFKVVDSASTNHPTDATVLLDADAMLKDKMQGPPVFVSADEAAKLKREVDEAKSNAQQAKKDAEAKTKADEAAYRATLMANMDCNYEFTNKENYFHISSICSDGVHTIIKAKPDEMPAVYELKDGTKDKNGSIINDSWDPMHNQWVIDRVVKNGFLRVGKRRQDFRAVS